ncbi:hypothetical protein BDZ45DRAFT_754584 [Acephala macrosclerotiorum]|nr:hypothetical protein BDZ45DRAFT_754584 [Acephala macrosclerotiorum]
MSGNFPKAKHNAKIEKTTLFPYLLTSRRLYNIALPLSYRCLNIKSEKKYERVYRHEHSYRRYIRPLNSLTGPRESSQTLINSWIPLATRITRLSGRLYNIENFELAKKIFFGFENPRYIEAVKIFRFGDLGLVSTTSSLPPQGVSYYGLLLSVLSYYPSLHVLDVQNSYFAHGILSMDEPLHKDARLSHLIVKGFCHIYGDKLLSFPADHSALKDSLEVLGLGRDWSQDL